MLGQGANGTGTEFGLSGTHTSNLVSGLLLFGGKAPLSLVLPGSRPRYRFY